MPLALVILLERVFLNQLPAALYILRSWHSESNWLLMAQLLLKHGSHRHRYAIE